MAPMSGARRLNWRIAGGAAALLTVLFGIQQWLAQPPTRQDLELGTSLLLQGITWGVWLLLLPLVFRVASSHPLEGRPTAGWVFRTVLEGAAFVVAHGVMSGTLRWAAGISIASDLGVVLGNSSFVRVREQLPPLLRHLRMLPGGRVPRRRARA